MDYLYPSAGMAFSDLGGFNPHCTVFACFGEEKRKEKKIQGDSTVSFCGS